MKKFILVLIIIFSIVVKSYAENINIAFTIDNKYPLYTLLTINSILLNNKSNSNFTFYIIENDVSLINKLKMKLYTTSHHQNIKFIHVDTYDIDQGINLYKKTLVSKHVSKIATARIYIPNLMPKDMHKILYLDSDILVISDIKSLYDIDINNYGAAMAKDNVEYLKRSDDKKNIYFNSGVILMNLDYWRENDITSKAINYIKNDKKYNFPDQDAINSVLFGKIKILPQKWNNMANIPKNPLIPAKDGGLLHYIGAVKPWTVQPNLTPEVELYYKYWDKSGWLKIYKIILLAYNLISLH